jgi:abortive infection bacteriophage resistance protein
MKYNKQPISIKDQILKLKGRGLKFENEPKCEHYLANISYYRLRAYTYPFQDNSNDDHPFNVEISFEKIIELYVFDRRIRMLLFDAIEKIEIAFRAQIIYNFALTHGSHWQLERSLFKREDIFETNIESLNKEIERSNETFIDHYKNKYTNPSEPPCWMSLEVSSIGLLSKMFQNLKKCKEKNAITTYFGLPDFSILENWMQCFSVLRNICAHHGRIWNRRLISIKIPNFPKNPSIQNKQIYPNKLYATLCCIEYILKIISPNNTLKNKIKEAMKNCPMKQEKEMGFPDGWEKDPFWN